PARGRAGTVSGRRSTIAAATARSASCTAYGTRRGAPAHWASAPARSGPRPRPSIWAAPVQREATAWPPGVSSASHAADAATSVAIAAPETTRARRTTATPSATRKRPAPAAVRAIAPRATIRRPCRSERWPKRRSATVVPAT
ncbi:MAG: hypothetical protein AVDCRST_MAG13-1067, partial [uncultured Solirubrobacteraceae bacterium]